LETTRQDFIVGLLIVCAIAIVVGALIATSGWGEHRYDIYLRVASAEGITSDTRAVLKGLEVGRVTRITPRVDPATGAISFLARLSVAETFQDGSRLRLPVGTRALIVPVTQIGSAALIRLEVPDTATPDRKPTTVAGFLGAGDTINSTRRASPLDALSEMASHLSKEVEEVLHESHRALTRVQGTLGQVNETVRGITPDVESTLHNVAGTMERLNGMIARVDRAGFPDSLSATLATSNRVLLRIDSLAATAQSLTTENRRDLREAVTNLTTLSRQLNHFVDEMSRRPYRLLTGVKPLPPVADTTRRADTRP
jgi:ABC-type transporter Mla subunit MlaD